MASLNKTEKKYISIYISPVCFNPFCRHDAVSRLRLKTKSRKERKEAFIYLFVCLFPCEAEGWSVRSRARWAAAGRAVRARSAVRLETRSTEEEPGAEKRHERSIRAGRNQCESRLNWIDSRTLPTQFHNWLFWVDSLRHFFFFLNQSWSTILHYYYYLKFSALICSRAV